MYQIKVKEKKSSLDGIGVFKRTYNFTEHTQYIELIQTQSVD